MTLFAVGDVETSGLDARKNYLLEVAVLIVDGDTLEIQDDVGFEAVVRYDPFTLADIYEDTNDYVTEMHEKNGLWKHLQMGKVEHLDRIDEELTKYLKSFGQPSRSMPFMGNSPRLDLNFFDEHLPAAAQELSYRMIDVSTVAALSNAWHGTPWFPKAKGHRGMADVREAIAELAYYREASFK